MYDGRCSTPKETQKEKEKMMTRIVEKTKKKSIKNTIEKLKKK